MNRFYSFCKIGLIALLAVGTQQAHAQTSDPKISHARLALELGSPQQAISELNAFIASNPKSADAHAVLAMAYLDLKNNSEASTEAQKAFDLDRKSVLARTSRAMVYGQQGKVEDALKEFQAALKLNDKDIGTYLAFSRYYISMDSLKPAEIMLYRAQQVNDKDVRSYIGLGELYEKQHITGLAIQQFEAAKKLDPNDISVMAKLAALYRRGRQYDASINEWIKVARTDSTYAPAYYEIANLYFLGEQYGNAAGFAEKYVQLKPDDLAGNWLLARSLAMSNQYTKALPYLEKVSANDSLKALSQLLLARSFFFSKDFKQSIQLYRAAKQLGPDDNDYYGRALFLSGDTTQAIEKLKLALANDTVRTEPTKAETTRQLASFLMAAKRYDEAGDLFLRMNDKHPSVDNFLAAAQMYSSVPSKQAQAEAAYSQAIMLDSTAVRAYAGLGSLYARMVPPSPKMRETFAKLEEVARAKNDQEYQGIANWGLGLAAVNEKHFDLAATHLEKAVKLLPPKSPYLLSAYLDLAISYHQLKSYAKAEENYKMVIEIDPTNKIAPEQLKNLKDAQPKRGR